MRKSLSLAAVAVTALGVAAPAAPAHTVASGDLTITNQQSATKTSFASQAWPSDTTGFIFLDTDRDNDADVTIVVDRDGPETGSTVVARRADGSTANCQAFSGQEIAPTVVTTSANGGFSVDLPSSVVGADFKVMPVVDDWQPCGGTDGFTGAYKAWTGTLRFTDATAPGAPTALKAVAGNGTASLDWADNTEKDLATYRVYRRATAGAFSLIATTATSQYADSGLTNGTDYTYYVRAFDERNASEESARVTVTPAAPRVDPTPNPPVDTTPVVDTPAGTKPEDPKTKPVDPGVPADLDRPEPRPERKPTKADGDPTRPRAKTAEAEKVTPKAVTLDLPERKKGQKLVIYRRTPGGTWVEVAITGKGEFTDKGVRPGKRYEYRVVVVNKKGKPVSAGSKILKVKVPKAKKGRR